MQKITTEDFSSPQNMKDVVGFYKKLTEQQEPLIRLDDYYGMGPAWLAIHYEDTAAILKDPRFIKDVRKLQPTQEQPDLEDRSEKWEWSINFPNMLDSDPPDHTRLRRLTAKAFTPQMIVNLEPRIQQIADELLDAVQKKGKMDLIADFAFPLPFRVITEMLGIPVLYQHKIRDLWVSIKTNPQQDHQAWIKAYYSCIRATLEEKRKHPTEDVISALLHAHDQGDKLSEPELLSTVQLLITAGHETTTNLIGNGMVALQNHPDQLALLRSNLSLLPNAIEELLRYAGPIMISLRFAGEDITMHGKNIRKGDMVLFSLGTANFDPKQFSNPEVFDITRSENAHLALGKGIHHCLGAPLARLEAKVAFRTLFRRFPDLKLAVDPDDLVYNHSGIVRSISSIPMTF
ncbi:cytochrome P450 [Paenibacillus sp. SC116]|uniref:cytochrome P450 family protein n=1 Tax=Paenibacillus sp. SC116 TaxID=2968986 RepID=UPI00215AFFBB|nr:cytochrome P450 [Paenibacillus sp. SC116]MCR8842395.1 cytochrome P450 [Paenibacillus sp. SC116]